MSAELTVVAGGSEPAPILKQVNFGALREQRVLTVEHGPGMRPRGNREADERIRQPRVVRGHVFGAFAESVATLELASKARTALAPIDPEPAPAQAMLRREVAQGFARRLSR